MSHLDTKHYRHLMTKILYRKKRHYLHYLY